MAQLITPAVRLAFLILMLPILPAHAQSPACAVDKPRVEQALGAAAMDRILSVETGSCNALVIQPDAVQFRLDANSLHVYNGIRSEIAVDFPYNEGDTVRYAWQMRMPEGSRGDAPLNRWWLIAQWHEQPDRRIHQKWIDLPVRSPPVSIYVEERAEGLGIGVHTNDGGNRSWARLPLGEWLDMSATIHWSRQDDGEVIFAVAEHPEFSVTIHGPNMHNGYQHYFKFGQYRHPKISVDSSVFFRDIRIKKY
jgi:hypothetical protein